MIKVIPRYEDHLWYPILVKVPGSSYNRIVEMRGREVNAWNDIVEKQRLEDIKTHPRGWCI